MRHILHIFDYIFYRIHKFVLAHPKMIVSDGAPYIFSFVVLLMPLLLIVTPIVSMYDIHIHRYSLGWTILMMSLVVLQLPIWKRYQKEENVRKFERCWNNENPQKKAIRGILVDILIINNIIIIPLFLYIFL